MKKERKPRRARGVIDAGSVYTQAGLMEAAGLGRTWLRKARAQGLRFFVEGRSLFYRGADIIAAIVRMNGGTP